MKLSKAVEGFAFALLADGYSTNTVEVYKWALKRQERYLKNPQVDTIELDDLRGFMLYMRTEYKSIRMNGDKSPLSGSSLENIWKGIRSFFNWASVDLNINRPDEKLKKPEYSKVEIHPYSLDEVNLYIKACISKGCPELGTALYFQFVRFGDVDFPSAHDNRKGNFIGGFKCCSYVFIGKHCYNAISSVDAIPTPTFES